ncbi:hypothetical protein [Hydrogenophaga sp.]|uniref:hypothetical protein n=1 Tax=Hydrogenophaga sp. TaxID=1904254 RepID=UPI0035B35026
MPTYNEFLEKVAAKESGGRYDIANPIGYLGKYQMGEPALIDSGYYQKDGTRKNDWAGTWTGKDGIRSKDDFLGSPAAQDNAIKDYMKLQWGYIRHYGLDKYVGQTMSDGVKITESGLLAGSHLLGISGLKDYVTSNGKTDGKDGNGTPISSYVKKFGGYETPFEPRAEKTGDAKSTTSPSKAPVDKVSAQLGPDLQARGYTEEQIRTISASALGLEAANVQRGPVQHYLLSKDGETIALKHEGAISEMKVSDALAHDVTSGRSTAPSLQAAPAERTPETPAMTR